MDKSALFEKYVKKVLIPYNFLGLDCFIRHWTERDRAKWELSLSKQDDTQKGMIRVKVIAWSLVDADGKPIFDDSDLDTLYDFPTKEVADAFEYLTKVQFEGDIEALKKSSEPTLNSDSLSDSPSP